MKGLFRHLASQTSSVGPVRERVDRRLEACLGGGPVRETLRMLPRPPPGAEERVWGRLEDDLDRRRLRAHMRPLRMALVVAGVALLGVAGGVTGTRWLGEPPPPPEVLDGPLTASEWEMMDPTPLVSLVYQGEGRVAGTEQALVIDWRTGTLRVSVAPEQGIRLEVRTGEGRAKVVGTGFSVVRDALGTTVAVSHGEVRLTCNDGRDLVLGPSMSGVCLPTSPAALLGRGLAQWEAGAGPDEVVATVDLGLAAGPAPSVRDELEVLRMQALAAGGQVGAAIQEGESVLARGTSARQEDVRHLLARIHLAQGGCGAAQAVLQDLRDHGQATAPELVQLADCMASMDPASARSALVDALRLGVPEEQQDAVVDRLTRLGRTP